MVKAVIGQNVFFSKIKKYRFFVFNRTGNGHIMVNCIFILGIFSITGVICERSLLGSYEAPYPYPDPSQNLGASLFSSSFNLKTDVTNPAIPASTIKIPFCNHYAVNRGSLIYTPCSANYLVAAENFGAILPPNMCTGMPCPTTGYNISGQETCPQMVDAYGQPLISSTTTLFDQYCDDARISTKRCVPRTNPAPNGPKYFLSPPVFTATTNWCNPSQTVQPVDVINRVQLTTGDGQFPFSFSSLTETQNLGKHTCPGDNGYGSKPVS
jgi:hypothetical protein